MTRDWTAEVAKYVKNPNEAAVKGLVRYLGIALKSRDSSYVACSQKRERDRLRDNFLKRKLGLTGTDAELDKAILDVCQKMRASRAKSRVTFCYLLADKFGKLSTFGG